MTERLYYRVFNFIVKYFLHCELQTIYFLPVLVARVRSLFLCYCCTNSKMYHVQLILG